jgi:hypothetical protein
MNASPAKGFEWKILSSHTIRESFGKFDHAIDLGVRRPRLVKHSSEMKYSLFKITLFLTGSLVNCLEHCFLLFFCLGIKFPQLFAIFQILFLLLSCINAVFVD